MLITKYLDKDINANILSKCGNLLYKDLIARFIMKWPG